MELVEEHLVMCDWCKTYLEQMELTVESLAGGGAPDVSRCPRRQSERWSSAFREWRARH